MTSRTTRRTSGPQDQRPGFPCTLLLRHAAAVAEVVATGITDTQDLTRNQLRLLPLEPGPTGWHLSVAGTLLADATIGFRYDRVVALSINPPDIEEGTAALAYLAGLEEAITTQCSSLQHKDS